MCSSDTYIALNPTAPPPTVTRATLLLLLHCPPTTNQVTLTGQPLWLDHTRHRLVAPTAGLHVRCCNFGGVSQSLRDKSTAQVLPLLNTSPIWAPPHQPRDRKLLIHVAAIAAAVPGRATPSTAITRLPSVSLLGGVCLIAPALNVPPLLLLLLPHRALWLQLRLSPVTARVTGDNDSRGLFLACATMLSASCAPPPPPTANVQTLSTHSKVIMLA